MSKLSIPPVSDSLPFYSAVADDCDLVTVGADTVEEVSRTSDILTLLERLPKIHLVVLDALLSHLTDLISSTKTIESDSVYIGKLAATLGPCLLRPSIDSAKTLNDRFPAQLFVDLLKNYPSLLPPALDKKDKVEDERYAPKRQRTKMIDQRLSRSAIGEQDEKEKERLLKGEIDKRMGNDRVSGEPEEMQDEPGHSVGKLDVQPLSSNEEDGATTNIELDTRKELLEITPRITEPSTSDGEKSVGYVTPPEEAEPALDSALSARNIMQSFDPVSTPSPVDAPSEVPVSLASEDDGDLDKPLATTVSLHRSATGPMGRRVVRPAGASSAVASASASASGNSAKTRGPRPMSTQLPSVAGTQAAATSPTGSPLPAGPAGVRARAALFEQKRALSPTSAAAIGVKTTGGGDASPVISPD